MDKELLLLILKNTKNSPILDLQSIEKDILRKKVVAFLRELEENGMRFQPTLDGSYQISSEQRTRLVILGMKNGLDFDKIIQQLTWQEFELLTTTVGDEFGFEAKTGLNFSSGERKYQIDVVLKNKPFVLFIDCKHFGGTGKKSALKKAVEEQIERAKALAKKVTDLQEKLKIASWKKIIFMPLIITWLDDEIYFYEKVPVVPFTKLRSFFDDFYIYFKDILQLEISK